MAKPDQNGMALLTEHLRYAPVTLLDDVINSINELSYKVLDAVEAGLGTAPPSALGFKDDDNGSAEEKATLEIENGVHQLETLINATIDKNFDTMELYALRNILNIPEDLRDWIKLRHYEGLNLVSSLDAPTIESINLQRRKYQENQRLQRHLQAETSRNAALIENLKSLRGSLTNETVPKVEPTESDAPPTYPAFAFLDKKGDLAAGSALAPLSTTTAFALSQLPALKALLAELRPQMKKLAEKEKNDPNLVQNESAKTFRRQRLEYIEIQTRKHLENVQGRELGKHGEVVDGEWQGEGRKLTRGEVEDLERVVAMVGGRSEDEMDQS